MKWPSSWTTTSTPSMRMKMRKRWTPLWARPVRAVIGPDPPAGAAKAALTPGVQGDEGGGRVPRPLPRRSAPRPPRAGAGCPGSSSDPARNRSTATSSAAMSVALAREPVRPAWRFTRRAGKVLVGLAERQGDPGGQVPRRRGRRCVIWLGQGVLDGVVHVRGAQLALPDLFTNTTAEWTTLCGWTTTSIASYSTSYSQCASMTSRPLLARVAVFDRHLRPHLPGRMAQCKLGTRRRQLRLRRVEEGPAGRGEEQPRDRCGGLAGQDMAEDGAVLGVDGPQPGERGGPRCTGISPAAARAARPRARGMTRWPPATRVSSLAVATTLPARSAARVERRRLTSRRRSRRRRCRPRASRRASRGRPYRRPGASRRAGRGRVVEPRPGRRWRAAAAGPGRRGARRRDRWRREHSPSPVRVGGHDVDGRRPIQPVEPSSATPSRRANDRRLR